MTHHHACAQCGGMVRPTPKGSIRRHACVECGLPVLAPAARPARHFSPGDFAAAVMRGLRARHRGGYQSARVA